MKFAAVWKPFSLALKTIMAIVMFMMMAITAVDVAGRYLFNAPISGGFEIVQYLMAFVVFAALPLTTASNGHLSVSLVEGRLRGGMKRLHKVYVLLLSLAGLLVLAVRMATQGELLSQSRQVSGYLALPLAPIAWALTVFAALAVFIVGIMLVRVIMGLDPQIEAAAAGAEID